MNTFYTCVVLNIINKCKKHILYKTVLKTKVLEFLNICHLTEAGMEEADISDTWKTLRVITKDVYVCPILLNDIMSSCHNGLGDDTSISPTSITFIEGRVSC